MTDRYDYKRDLRSANVARQKEWGAFDQLTLAYRGNELAGEVGEACNVIKKLERERIGIAGSRDTVAHLAEELADVVICADLIAMHEGIDLLGEAVPAKFNATSEKVGLKTRYEPALRRLASSDSEVKVRELEWADRGVSEPRFKADAVIGTYYIEHSKAGLFNWWAAATRGKIEVRTLDAAKAAAQADYEARIRSALVVEPTPDTSVVAMREALEQIKAICIDNCADTVRHDLALKFAGDVATKALAANQSDGGECACGNFADGKQCPGPDGRPLCASPAAPDQSDTPPTPPPAEAVSVDEVALVLVNARRRQNGLPELTADRMKTIGLWPLKAETMHAARALLAKFKMERR